MAGRPIPGGLGDPPPDVVRRVLNAHRSGESVRQIMSDWRADRDGRRAFNDRLRREAGVGFVADAEQVLSQAGTEGHSVTARDTQTGRYADLNQAARDAASQPIPGGIVPTEQGAPIDANSLIRREYERVVARREER